MPDKIYLALLIFGGIWFQGIIRVFANENITESSSFLVRQKRVISLVPQEDMPVSINEHPYIAIVKINNRIYCVGTILSHRIVLTTADCASTERTHYKIITSSSRSNRAVVPHNVTDIKLHLGNHPSRPTEGIGLLTIEPAIVFSGKSNKINLHVGPVLPGTIGTVSGWGFIYRNRAGSGTRFPLELRSIEVPIMAHNDCVNRYQPSYPISDQDICTFHPQRHAGHNDAGAPLVIDNYLVGIFLRRGPIQLPFNDGYPDVFAFLQHTHYSAWIMANI